MSRNFFLRPSTERKPISPRLVWPWWYGSCCRFRVVCFGRIKATKTIQKIDYQNHQCLLSHQHHRESSSRMCVFFCFACPRLGRPEVPVRRSGARENVLLFWRGSLPSSLDFKDLPFADKTMLLVFCCFCWFCGESISLLDMHVFPGGSSKWKRWTSPTRAFLSSFGDNQVSWHGKL